MLIAVKLVLLHVSCNSFSLVDRAQTQNMSYSAMLHQPLRGEVLFHGSPNPFGGFSALLRGHKYRITTRNVEIKVGVWNAVVNNVELWRVKG